MTQLVVPDLSRLEQPYLGQAMMLWGRAGAPCAVPLCGQPARTCMRVEVAGWLAGRRWSQGEGMLLCPDDFTTVRFREQEPARVCGTCRGPLEQDPPLPGDELEQLARWIQQQPAAMWSNMPARSWRCPKDCAPAEADRRTLP